ncbi:MAG: hypothetical protein AMJ84_01630 [Acidithiobacillales bacterium SM23_46]|nr:MAG: hypothetical protein AMJ84_01630 [Acidithiobacillales bacterium SM23_46]KPL25934.1 MAG: hypothetical protein AMJ72_12935 [Acidithiobacillales bacterium SM1_46]
MLRVTLKALVAWLGILTLAIANGGFREGLLLPALGRFVAQVLSGIMLASFIFLAALVAVRWIGRLRAAQYWTVGLYWLVLTLVFEFGFGLWVQHKDWSELLAAYTFQGGNIWPVVLLATLVAPWVAARVQGRIKPSS